MREVFRLQLDAPLPAPVLAAGGDLKCAPALGVGREVIVYEDFGDLAMPENQDRFHDGFRRLLDSLDGQAPVLVCDKHPHYVSSGFARRLARERGLPCVEVQHHRAHVAAVAAEHGLLGQSIVGLAFDGTGYGDDGTIWGGEFFVGPVSALARQGAFAPLTLCGGDAAVRQPWRIALALLIESGFSEEVIAAWAETVNVPLTGLPVFRAALAKGIQCVKTTALGRWFDCFSALWGVRTEIQFEAQAAIDLQKAAETYDGGCFFGAATVRWMDRDLAVITFEDLLETVDYMLTDWGPRHAAAFARQFHVSVADAVCEVAAEFARQVGTDVVLSGGGCFLNSLLCGMIDHRLTGYGLRRLASKALPPGDQAIALGQVVLCDAHRRDGARPQRDA